MLTVWIVQLVRSVRPTPPSPRHVMLGGIVSSPRPQPPVLSTRTTLCRGPMTQVTVYLAPVDTSVMRQAQLTIQLILANLASTVRRQQPHPCPAHLEHTGKLNNLHTIHVSYVYIKIFVQRQYNCL